MEITTVVTILISLIVGGFIGSSFSSMSKRNMKRWEENLKKSEEQLKTARKMRGEIRDSIVEWSKKVADEVTKKLKEIYIVNGYRHCGVVQLTQKDFDDIPILNKGLEGFDTVSQQIIFQMKMVIEGEWYLLEIYQQDNEVNTGIIKIEMTENYET